MRVGEDPASAVYVRNKLKASREAGIASFAHDLPASASEAQLLALIAELTDSFAIVNRSSGGTEVRMRFKLEQARLRRDEGGGQSVSSSNASAARPAASTFSTIR